MIKNLYAFLIRYSPVLVLLIILFYLGRSNKSSEVYIDLQSTSVSFALSNEVELLSNVLFVDSILLQDCHLTFRAKHMLGSDNIDVKMNPESTSGKVMIRNGGTVNFKDLSLSQNSMVRFEAGVGTAIIEFIPHQDSVYAADDFLAQGEINVGDSFSFIGQSMLIEGFPELTFEQQYVEVRSSAINKNIKYTAGSGAKIQLFFNKETDNGFDGLIADKFIDRLSFVSVDKTKKKNREKSAIQKAEVEIAGVDFFGKQFLLKEHEVNEGDFLLVPAKDQYYIDVFSVKDGNINMEISSEIARDLQTGHRYNLVRSIFPSLLDFMISEPSKKTIWTVLIFLLAQYQMVKSLIVKQFGNRKNELNDKN